MLFKAFFFFFHVHIKMPKMMTVQNLTTSSQLVQIYLKKSRTHKLMKLLFYIVGLNTLCVMENILRAFFIYHKYRDHICQHKKVLSETHFWHMLHVTFIASALTEQAISIYFIRSDAYIIRFKSVCDIKKLPNFPTHTICLSLLPLKIFSSLPATIKET
jgi:hypothetical protein